MSRQKLLSGKSEVLGEWSAILGIIGKGYADLRDLP
jgi:hypothetical protein